MFESIWLGMAILLLYPASVLGSEGVSSNSDLLAKYDALLTYADGLRKERASKNVDNQSGTTDSESAVDERPIREVFSERVEAVLDEIARASENDKVTIFREFIRALHLRELSQAETEAASFVYAQMRSYLSLESEDMLLAGVPLLESGDLSDRRAGLMCLETAIGEEEGKTDIVWAFLTTQVASKSEASTALVDFLIQCDTASALSHLRALYHTDGDRDERLGKLQVLLEQSVTSSGGALRSEEHVKELASCLQAAADDSAWWVRLCVAEVMRRIPELRLREVIEQLRIDEHPRVKEAISAMDNRVDESQPIPRLRVPMGKTQAE